MLKIIQKTYLLIAVLSIVGSIILYFSISHPSETPKDFYAGLFRMILLIFNLLFLLLSTSIFLNLYERVRNNSVLRLLSFYFPLIVVFLSNTIKGHFTSIDFKGLIMSLPFAVATTIGYYYFRKKYFRYRRLQPPRL